LYGTNVLLFIFSEEISEVEKTEDKRSRKEENKKEMEEE
jgi:hypothetical protein